MARTPNDHGEHYSEQESQQRFEKLAKAALNTPPKPLNSIPPKRAPSQSKKRQKTKAK